MAQIVKVRDAMSTDVREIAEDATLQAGAKGMADARVNSLVVRPKGKEEPFGISTSPDIVDASPEPRSRNHAGPRNRGRAPRRRDAGRVPSRTTRAS